MSLEQVLDILGSRPMPMLASNCAQTCANPGPRSGPASDRTSRANSSTCSGWSTLTTPAAGYLAA
jgi:hypothetical protein